VKAHGRFAPVLLLVGAGAGIGSIFPLAKVASLQGVPPLAFAFGLCFGAGTVLLAASLARGRAPPLDLRHLRYYLLSGLLGIALPWTLVVGLVPRIGSGLPAVVQSLAPILTLAIVLALGHETLNGRRLAGLAAGMAGMLIAVLARNEVTVGESIVWQLLALVTPLSLAFGNVYRTAAWPAGGDAVSLAAGSLFAAALFDALALAGAAATGLAAPPTAAAIVDALPLIGAQSLLAGFGYLFFFRLQQLTGPVFLSQVSYANTTTGLVFAVFLFGEPLSPWLAPAVFLVFAGVWLVNRTQPGR